MNKSEKQIILDRYELILNARELGIDKSDSIRELSSLIDALGMKKRTIYCRKQDYISF